MKEIKLRHSIEDIRDLFRDWIDRNDDIMLTEISMPLMERVDDETWAFIEVYAIFNLFAGIYYGKTHSNSVEIVADPYLEPHD
jgi:hypothetical protein